jgi:hypothetical protein
VSAYVVDHARRPVVVIRPGQGLDDAWPIDPSARGSSATLLDRPLGGTI